MKGGRVLVVDDEPMVRDTLGQVLADEGYVVDLAIDGESALERVHAARPDAILLDLMMPGMNGRQFLQALRTQPEYARVPVLIMTAVHGLNVNLQTLGASEVVEKPFDVDELLNKVALAVYRSSGTYEVQTGPLNAITEEPPDEAPRPIAADDAGVVLIVEHDRARLQQLDLALSQRGYTVVSMTRALGQLSRLARALRPRAILLDRASEGVAEVAAELRRDPAVGGAILEFSRAAGTSDHDLVGFVDNRP